MTRSAIIDDVSMIEGRRDEALWVMTDTAILISIRVWGSGRLSCG